MKFVLLNLISFIVLSACSEITFEPVTVDAIVVNIVSYQIYDQGEFNFSDLELNAYLPTFDSASPLAHSFIELELVALELYDEQVLTKEVKNYYLAQIINVDSYTQSVMFEGITFYHAGIYTFRISQSRGDFEDVVAHEWVFDTAVFYFEVEVLEDYESEALVAYLTSEELLFENISVWDLEQMLVNYFNSAEYLMSSENALLINLTTGEVLFDYFANQLVYPASITKIMTVLVGILAEASEGTVTVYADFDGLYLSRAMQSGFVLGEERTFSEILHAVMLSSGGEATEALANHIAGSYEDFVLLMNKKAYELEMFDTYFVTATGLHHELHQTTARDIAKLLQYALDIPEFRAIFTTEEYKLERPNSFTDTLRSTLFHFAPTMTFSGGEILGGRTGFTNEAGRTLASLATDGVDEFILITFGAKDEIDNQINHILDALMIYEYFFQ